MNKKAKAYNKKQNKLLREGKISFAQSYENKEALDKLVEERKDNINIALKTLGMKEID